SLYLVRPWQELGPIHPWVQDNVMPVLDACPKLPLIAKGGSVGREIARFLANDPHPTVIADWPEDFRHFNEALLTSIPGEMVNVGPITMKLVPQKDGLVVPTILEGAVPHNAWWDAMTLREALK